MTEPVKPFRLDGTELAGYRIHSLVGRGGMAYVYRAEDRRLGRMVALKVLAPELTDNESFRRRFLRESQMAASIDHPNIVPIYDAGEADGLLFIVMRYVDGTDLKAVLSGGKQLDGRRLVDLFTQVAAALDAAHDHGLVHSDVKPANILISPGAAPRGHDHVYLSDFGITKRAATLSGVTEAGVVIGTIDYLAPEQIAGKPVTAQTDLYALGCVVYQALAGSVPFVRDDDAALLWAHLAEAFPPISQRRPDLPPAVQEVLGRAMAKSPDDRYDSCGEFMAEMAVALGSGSARAASGGDPTQGWSAPSQTRRRPPVNSGVAYRSTPVPGDGRTRDDTPPPYVTREQSVQGRVDWNRVARERAAQGQAGLDHSGPGNSPPDHAIPDHGRPDYSTPDYGGPDYGGPDYGGPDYGDRDYADAAPRYGDAGPPRRPRRPGRKAIIAVIAGIVAITIALFGFQRWWAGQSTVQFTGDDLVPFSFRYPDSWSRDGASTNVVFSPHAKDLVPIFQSEAPDWSGANRIARDDPGGLVGMYTNFSFTGYGATPVDQAKTIQEQLAGASVSDPRSGVKVGNGTATLLPGTLTSASSPVKIRFNCYVAQVDRPQPHTVVLMLFSTADTFDDNRATFDKIAGSVDLYRR